VPNYLIKGIIPRTGLVVIWGPPKCGKSFWTFDLMMYAALGRPYRGRRVQQGAVVYLALEGGYGFQARVEAWRRRHLANHRDPVPFYLLDVPVDLIADHQRLIAAIKAQFGSQIIPAAVVIDTLNRALMGDENKSDDMAKFIRASDMIRQAFGCVVPIVHHCGVAGGRPRLDRVELGDDDDGDPIRSCVIVPAEARPVGCVDAGRVTLPWIERRRFFGISTPQKLNHSPASPRLLTYISSGPRSRRSQSHSASNSSIVPSVRRWLAR
jgi:hypothetical protein